MGWLLIGIASFAIWCGFVMAGSSPVPCGRGLHPALTGGESRYFRRLVLDVNLRGVWNCMGAELRQMMGQGRGAIVNCSSIGGMRGSKGRAAYSASKFGVIGLARCCA